MTDPKAADAVGADVRASLIAQLHTPIECKITGERPWVKPAVLDLARAGAQYADLIETRRELKRERDAIGCEREWRPTIDECFASGDRYYGPPVRPTDRPQDKACWSWVPSCTYEGVSYGEPYGEIDTSHHVGGDPADWCEPCQRRAEIHGRYQAAGRKIGPAYLRLRCALMRLAK